MFSRIHSSARPVAALSAVAACLFAASNASALTAKEVADKMSNDQRSHYLFGMIEMLQAQALISGDKQKSQCIFNAYFRSDGAKGDAMAKLFSALDQFPDRQATDIVYLMIKKTCGG